MHSIQEEQRSNSKCALYRIPANCNNIHTDGYIGTAFRNSVLKYTQQKLNNPNHIRDLELWHCKQTCASKLQYSAYSVSHDNNPATLQSYAM